MKIALAFCLSFLLLSCNLAKWNQDRLDKKFDRNGIEESFFVTTHDSIHYFEGGSGPIVMLIHGFGADAQITWEKSILDLSSDFHLVCPDLLWFGESVSTRTPNLEAQISAMWSLMDDKTAEPFHIAGLSYGGFVSMGMLYAAPNKIKSLCMIDSPGVTFNLSFLDSLCQKHNVKSVDEIFVVKTHSDLKRLRNISFYNDKKIPKKILQDAYKLYFDKNHKKLKLLIESLIKDADQLLDRSIDKFPKSLVIWGESDMVFPLSEGKKLANFLGAEIKIIPKAGHVPNLEQFKKFETVFRAFLEDAN